MGMSVGDSSGEHKGWVQIGKRSPLKSIGYPSYTSTIPYLLLIKYPLLLHNLPQNTPIILILSLLSHLVDMDTSPPILAKCTQGNDILDCCMKVDCSHPSAMCGLEDCQCHKHHQHCLMSTKVSKLKTSLQKKRKSLDNVFQEILIWYRAQIKTLSTEMDSIKELSDNKTLSLSENEEKLYSYLIDGRSTLILPELVAGAIASVSKQSLNPVVSDEKVRKQLHAQGLRLKLILKEIENMVKVQEKPNSVSKISKIPPSKAPESAPKNESTNISIPTLENTRFTEQLCHPSIQIINNHTIRSKVTKSNFVTALLPITLYGKPNSFKALKYRFRINKLLSEYFMLGVIQLSNFSVCETAIHNKLEYGALAYQNAWHLGREKGHERFLCGVKGFRSKDDVEVRYERGTQTVVITNYAEGSQSSSVIAPNPNLPLYVAVVLYSPSDEVELMKISCSE